MPKLLKKIPKLFGSSGPTQDFSQFGSLRAGIPNTTKDPDVIQNLANFLDGWRAAVMGNNSPAIEDMNSLFFLLFYFNKYTYENGLPELDLDEVYYLNSMLKHEGAPLVAIRDDFMPTPVGGLGPLNPTDFASLGCQVQFATLEDENALRNKDIILCNANGVAGGTMNLKIPLCSTLPLGKKYIIKNTSTKGSSKQIHVFSGIDSFDGAASVILSAVSMNESITIINNGTGWSIV